MTEEEVPDTEEEAMPLPPQDKPTRQVRRFLVFTTVFFCFGELIYLTVLGGNSQVHESIVSVTGMVLITIIVGYLWFRTIETNFSSKKYDVGSGRRPSRTARP